MYIYGASGHGKVIAEIAESNHQKVSGFIDEDTSKKKVLGYEVFHQIPENGKELLIAIGNNRIRKTVVNNHPTYMYPVLQHKQALVSKYAMIGEGSVVMAGVTINAEAKIGAHCIINTNASIDHDCILDNFVHISPNVALAGNVHVGEGTHIGIGACVIQGITIGKWCTIGAGAVIIRDVEDGATMVGNPGKRWK